MRPRNLFMILGLIVALSFFVGGSLAQAPEESTIPPGDSERSNRSGLRGLDRADQAAGEAGQHGRDIARENVLRGGDRPERFNRPERAKRPERLQLPERADRPERFGR
ncbi:MAG: hypothetical protein KatS3mg082_2070 [Nitrospiraceae bacterium]|nr:MAG: hypothetical protein KatS3mg082_2070 [Nitrospiraceae bacterium]